MRRWAPMTEAGPLRVSLVEDHPLVGDMLREFVAGLAQVGSCTVATSAESCLQQLENGTPDVMFIDLSLPGMDGIELIRELRARYRDLRCAILSAHRSKVYAKRAMAAGACGYVLKGDPIEIESALHSILAGEPYVSRDLQDDG